MEHIGVIPLFGIVPVGSCLHVVDEGVVGPSGGVDGSRKNLAESGEAHVARACSPHHTLDGVILLHKAQFKGIGTVIDNNDVFKIVADQLYHVLLGVVELEVMVAFVPVFIIFRIVGIDIAVCHILRDVVVAFTCEAGDHDDRGVGEFLCVGNQFITVIFHRRFREVPVLGSDGDRCTVRGKGGVEVDQLLVYLKPGIPDTVDEAHLFIQIIDAAGACPAVHRIGRAPAE